MQYPVPLLPAILASCSVAALAAVAFDGQPYVQDFDALPATGTVSLPGSATTGTPVAIPGADGWYAARLGGTQNGDLEIVADNGQILIGGIRSYGNPDSTERALGLLYSAHQYGAVGAAFVNASGATIDSLRLSYDHEVWAVQSAASGRVNPFHDILEFAYGTTADGVEAADFLTSATMRRHAGLDAVSYSHRGFANATSATDPDRMRDGNDDLWRERLSAVLTGLDWRPWETLYIRWQDSNSGDWRGPMNDHNAAHGIDNVTIEIAAPVPAPQPKPRLGVRIDGQFDDWNDPALLHFDTLGDARSGTDLHSIGGYVSTDGLALYLRTTEPFDLANSQMRILLDTDGDPATGNRLNGIGVDVTVDFAPTSSDDRFYPAQVQFHAAGETLWIQEFVSELQPNIYRTGNTVSDRYEFLIPLTALPGVQPGGRIGILFVNVGGPDLAPNAGSTFHVDVPHGLFVEHTIPSLDKIDPADVRVLGWNAYEDYPADPARQPSYVRVLQAIQPDIVNFQELYNSTAEWARTFITETLPPPAGAQWYAAKNSDCITVSRYEILGSYGVDGNLIVWVRTRDVWGVDSLIVNSHTPATNTGHQEGRLYETDNIMLLLRRLLSGRDPLGPPDANLAVFAIGDYNARPPMPELSNLRLGRFHDSGRHALNFRLDAYDLPLADVAARHVHAQRLYTFTSQGTSRTLARPRIDQILYSPSHLTRRRAYVVDTYAWPDGLLAAYGLQRNDTQHSDHLPVVADFQPRALAAAWNAVDHYEDGWFHSRWLGPLYDFGASFQYSPLHGPLYTHPGPHGIWLHEPALGWWFSDAERYPYAWLDAATDWIYFAGDAAGDRRYYDYAAGAWMIDD
jgi:exonuclease III